MYYFASDKWIHEIFDNGGKLEYDIILVKIMKFGTKLKRHKTKKHSKTLNDVINTVFPDNEIPKYSLHLYYSNKN